MRLMNSRTAAERDTRMAKAAPQAGVLGLSRAQGWGILFFVYSALAVLFFLYHYLDDLSRQRAGTSHFAHIEELTGVYTVFLLLPLVLRVADFYLFKSKGWAAPGCFPFGRRSGILFVHTSF